MRILVTGATGFVGSAIAETLACDGLNSVVGTSRHDKPQGINGVSFVQVGELGPTTNWEQALARVDVVVHSAARVHVMRENREDALEAYRITNSQGSEKLARDAVAAGVRRLIFLSSVKVLGEETRHGLRFAHDSDVQPTDPYAQSKAEAEKALLKIGRTTDLEVVIIRPPLVYGPGVGANFQSMMRVVGKGIPLPLNSVQNQRSMVFVDNLVSLVALCCSHAAAAGQTFMVSDCDDFSTPELLRSIGNEMGVPSRLFSIPEVVLRALGKLIGKSREISRLTSSLQVDCTHTTNHLSWAPPVTLVEGIRKTVLAYQASQGGKAS